MRSRTSPLLLLALLLASLSKTSSLAETQVQHFLHKRGVRRMVPADVHLPVFNPATADRSGRIRRSGSEEGSRIQLDFFPDVSLVVHLNHLEMLKNNAFAWYGDVEGSLYGHATFVV